MIGGNSASQGDGLSDGDLLGLESFCLIGGNSVFARLARTFFLRGGEFFQWLTVFHFSAIPPFSRR